MMALFAEFDLAKQQAFALVHLEPDQPKPMSELAAAMFCDASNITGIADRLEARGLVERVPSAQDRRVKTLVPHPRGRPRPRRVGRPHGRATRGRDLAVRRRPARPARHPSPRHRQRLISYLTRWLATPAIRRSPPSTTYDWPVTYEAPGDTRKAMRSATSRTRPGRPAGIIGRFT